MRRHEHDTADNPSAESPARGRPTTAESVAQGVVGEGSTKPLQPPAVMHLQRAAGNRAVGSLLDDEVQQPSPVLDVVGKGGGRPLDPAVRKEMESALDQDFSDVRVHTGAAASASARAVQAQAYTVGSEIVFEGDRYAPHTDEGRGTLAHELTHVAQQRSGPVEGTAVAGGISVSDPSDRFERAATEMADKVGAAATHRPAPLTEGSIQRDVGAEPLGGSAAELQRQAGPEEEEERPEA